MRRTARKIPITAIALSALAAVLFAVLVVLLVGRAVPAPGSAAESSPIPADAPEPEYLEYGEDTSLDIDASVLTHPDEKNNLDLAAYAGEAWKHRWGYVWGTVGDPLSEELLAYKLEQYPTAVGDYEEFIREHWMGRRTADCIGLIKSYAWFDPYSGFIAYQTNDIPDIGTDELFEAAEEKGPIDTIPELPGVIVYREGHVGIYIGGGFVIEAHGTEGGVVKTKLAEQPFTDWLKYPGIIYYE